MEEKEQTHHRARHSRRTCQARIALKEWLQIVRWSHGRDEIERILRHRGRR